jgi:hypothetical protein
VEGIAARKSRDAKSSDARQMMKDATTGVSGCGSLTVKKFFV